MLRKFATLLLVMPLVAIGVSAQGLDTNASKDDWEEINFEFNSSVLVDGFPSLLRLAELLQKNPGYKVKVEGHTDRLGSNPYNDKLGMARASTVRDFLVKYGARAGQIEVSTRGKADPRYPGQKPVYTKTDEARWMNRRVFLTVTDDQGRTVSAGGVGPAIQAIEPAKPAAMADCCADVLRRLDKLDDIAKMLKDMADQNAGLQRDIAALKQNQEVIESKVNQPPPHVPTAEEVAAEVNKGKKPMFQVLNANVGADGNGNVTFTGKGRFFAPFGSTYAFQAQGEYLYFRGQKEGQFDFGLIDRINRFQAGLFASFKNVSLAGNQNSGTLGQASLTMDYLFKWGKVGIFGTKGFLDSAQINSQQAVLANGFVTPDLIVQRYLRIVDQVGLSTSLGLWGNNYLEGNAGFLRSYGTGDHFGGTLRFIFPLNTKIAVTVEGGINETLVGPSNNGRAVVGLQFGNAIRPKEMLDATTPVPVDVPRIRYDILTRTVRVGHTPPVADAGPNQIGIPAGTVTLNGSGSYSPDGLPLTYQWTQQAGPSVALSNPTGVTTTFSAAAGQAYTFSLMVKDSLGGQAMARVNITTVAAVRPVVTFSANPTQINAGQSSVLSWTTTGATSVSISGIGSVALNGTASVSPTQTTTYTLTATGNAGTTNATATVTVGGSQVQLVYCYATPATIIAGESATLYYQAQGATSVTISGLGTQGAGGSVAVSPTTTTNYTITANGAGGTTASCSIAVQVTPGTNPRIIQFSANPASITSGQSSTLTWVTDNATTVSITTLGNVALSGSQAVSPTVTTAYTLTATNSSGSSTAVATVTVTGAGPTISSFTATPPTSPSPGSLGRASLCGEQRGQRQYQWHVLHGR